MTALRVTLLRIALLALPASTIGFGCSGGGGSADGTGGTAAIVVPPECMDPATTCNSTCAKTAYPCAEDCSTTCGFNSMGTKNCTCGGGSYTMCPCPKPAEYLGAETAPYCDTYTSQLVPLPAAEGFSGDLKEKDCTAAGEWAQCIGRDPVDGTPKGCACMKNKVSQALEWFCGSTNKWFAIEPGAQ